MDSIITEKRECIKFSYNNYKKSSVFSHWQKQLQIQSYEVACHWTAEIDCSGWQEMIWDKIILFNSKFVHLHCPKLPLVIVKNYLEYLEYHQKYALHSTKMEVAHCNQIQLRVNLCQVVGLLSLSSKGPVYQLSKVDSSKINKSEIQETVHPWVASKRKSGDMNIIVKLISTMFYYLEKKSSHKTIYWLSVLLEVEKKAKKEKEVINMANRNASVVKHYQPNAKDTDDWIWLVWDALHEGCQAYYKPEACVKTIHALRFLFGRNYVRSKKNSRIHLLIHAMHLVNNQTLDWTKSIYPSTKSQQMIGSACKNINIMYQEIKEKGEKGQLIVNPVETQKSPTTSSKTEQSKKRDEGKKTDEVKKSEKSKESSKKSKLSSTSLEKLAIIEKIDNHHFLF